LPFISLISAPAANTFSPPVSTTQAILLSSAATARCALSSLKRAPESALSASGRLSVIVMTRPEGERDERTRGAGAGAGDMVEVW
jgi:hypothetical protein